MQKGKQARKRKKYKNKKKLHQNKTRMQKKQIFKDYFRD